MKQKRNMRIITPFIPKSGDNVCQQTVLHPFFLLLFLFLVFINPDSYAQTDTKFWFVAPAVDESNGDQPILLRISADEQPAHVTIWQPANADFKPIKITVMADSMQTIDLSERIDFIENQPVDKTLHAGILIEADNPVSAYYEVAANLNQDIFPLKGEKALGLEFYIPSQITYPNARGSEAFDIVATEDNTEITITPSADIYGHKAGVAFTITLQRGETYSARAVSIEAGFSLAGSKVVANKPIAITISDDSINTDGWELIGDQIVPTTNLGTEYIVVQGFADKAERIYILAVTDNTMIKIDQSVVATLSAGETYTTKIDRDVAHIISSEPVYVLHLSGYPREAGAAVLPAIACTGSKKIAFTRTQGGSFAFIILTKRGNENGFLLDGKQTSILSKRRFQPVPTQEDEWVFARIELEQEIPIGIPQQIENTYGLFHLGIISKFGQGAEYGYFSDYKVSYLGNDIMACAGDTVTLNASIGEGTYLWSTGAKQRTIKVTEPGKYWVKVNAGTCSGIDTINVSFDTLPDLGLDPVASLIKGKELVLNAYIPNGKYIWHDGSPQHTLTVTKPGKYWVEVAKGGCRKRYTIDVKEIEIEFSADFITFESGQSDLTAEAKKELNNLVQYLKKHEDMGVKIAAHTDNVGTLELNMKLSEERAKSVMQYLTAKGIEKKRIAATGYADTRPIADNATEKGRAQNRRVEFNILHKSNIK